MADKHLHEALEAERLRLRHLFDRAPGFVLFTRGPEHVVEQANAAVFDLIGPREVIGRPLCDAVPELVSQGYLDVLDTVFHSGRGYSRRAQRVLLQRHAGQAQVECVVDLVLQPIVDESGQVTGVCAQGQDVTWRERMEADMRHADQRWKLALEASGGGMWEWNPQTNEVVFSPRMKSMMGYADHELSNHISTWEALVHPEDRERVLREVTQHVQGSHGQISVEYRIRHKNGSWIWVLARGTVVKWDEQGQPVRAIGTNTDITATKQSEHRIWMQANFDTLTGLPNRRLFRDRLDQEVLHARRSGKALALLFIDLDRFKEVNDLYGHDAGDSLLVEAGQRIRSRVREQDTVARLGGDEFTVVLTSLEGLESVERIAQDIIDVLAQPYMLGADVAHVSASVGITVYPADADSPEEMIRKADQAMYAAKQAGKNRFSYFTAQMDKLAHYRLRLIHALRGALRAGQISVHYQPIVELGSGRIVKAEALARWRHPQFGPVGPAQFIPLAEESGTIHQIGDWVFREAARQARDWSRELGAPFQVGVNKSPLQFMSKTEDGWLDYLRSLQLPPQCLTVEITESLLLHASGCVEERLLQYRDAGVQVALDDFGTGYSSMAYLKKFDIDILKIDQSFVQDMAVDQQNRAIAESIIAMAHKLGLRVIAEGVETEEQRSILQDAGCDYGQGYLFSRPLAAAQFQRLLLGRGQQARLH